MRDNTLYIHIEIALKIWKQHQALGAYQIYCAARSLNTTKINGGAGILSKKDLFSYLKNLGVTESTMKRWFKEALKLGFLKLLHQDTNIHVPGFDKLAIIVGLDKFIYRPVLLTISEIVSPNFKSNVWAGLLELTANRKPSRKTLVRLTGIPIRTQVRLEESLNINRTKQHAILPIKPSEVIGYKENVSRNIYVKRLDFDHLVTCMRMPDLRRCFDVELGSWHISKRLNKKLLKEYEEKQIKNDGVSVYSGRGKDHHSKNVVTSSKLRLYHLDNKYIAQTQAQLKVANVDNLDMIFKRLPGKDNVWEVQNVEGQSSLVFKMAKEVIDYINLEG